MTPKNAKRRMEKERAALLNPKSKGWKAGADRLLAELKARKSKERK